MTSGKTSLPENWPAGIPYLISPRYSPSLTPSQLAAIRTGPSTDPHSLGQDKNGSGVIAVPRNLPRGPCRAVDIRGITDPRHPACGQRGLFAARRLEPGSLILLYLGEVHPGTAGPHGPSGSSSGSTSEAAPSGAATAAGSGSREKVESTEDSQDDNYDYAQSDYDLWLSRDADVAVDAARCGNEARFVNDYRGVPGAMRANAEFREVWDPRPRPRRQVGPADQSCTESVAATTELAESVAGEWTMAVFVLPLGKKALAKHQQRQLDQQRRNQPKTGKGRRFGAVGGGAGRKDLPPGGINEGEEILVSYGKGFWEKRRQEAGTEEDAEEEKAQQESPL